MVWYTQAMKEGEQGSFLDIIDSDPVAEPNRILYARLARVRRVQEKWARRTALRQYRLDVLAAEEHYEKIREAEYDKRLLKSELQMRVFRLDTEITDTKVELAGLISQARARIELMHDLEWQNC